MYLRLSNLLLLKEFYNTWPFFVMNFCLLQLTLLWQKCTPTKALPYNTLEPRNPNKTMLYSAITEKSCIACFAARFIITAISKLSFTYLIENLIWIIKIFFFINIKKSLFEIFIRGLLVYWNHLYRAFKTIVFVVTPREISRFF